MRGSGRHGGAAVRGTERRHGGLRAAPEKPRLERGVCRWITSMRLQSCKNEKIIVTHRNQYYMIDISEQSFFDCEVSVSIFLISKNSNSTAIQPTIRAYESYR